MSRVFWVVITEHPPPPPTHTHTYTHTNTGRNPGRKPNAGLMLGQRRRRWPNIIPALVDGLVFAGTIFLRKAGYS